MTVIYRWKDYIVNSISIKFQLCECYSLGEITS